MLYVQTSSTYNKNVGLYRTSSNRAKYMYDTQWLMRGIKVEYNAFIRQNRSIGTLSDIILVLWQGGNKRPRTHRNQQRAIQAINRGPFRKFFSKYANVHVTIQSHGLSAGARPHYVTTNGVRNRLLYIGCFRRPLRGAGDHVQLAPSGRYSNKTVSTSSVKITYECGAILIWPWSILSTPVS